MIDSNSIVSQSAMSDESFESNSIVSESAMSDDSSEPSEEKMFICSYCNKSFSTRFSKNRHETNFHEESMTDDSDDDKSNVTDNDTDESVVSANDNNSETSTDDEEVMSNDSNESDSVDNSEESMSVDSEEESKARVHPFRNLIKRAYLKSLEGEQEEEDEEEQEKHFQDDLKRRASKNLRRIFVDYLLDLNDMKKDPLFIAIIKKAKHLEEKDGFLSDDALKAAVDHYKHSINKLIA